MTQGLDKTAQGEERPDSRLHGRLGTGSVVFMVIAAAAPLTVISGNVPLSVALGNGAGAPVGFLIASTVLLLFAIGFVTMTPYVREAGAFYSYVTEGLGKRLGMGIAVVALIAYTAIQLGVYGFMGWAVGDAFRFYGGPELPWPVYAFVTIAIVAFLGYRHINLSAKVLGVALVLEIGIVLILDLFILLSGGADGVNFQSFTPDTFLAGSLGVPVLFALTGFIGFESTAVFRDEARDLSGRSRARRTSRSSSSVSSTRSPAGHSSSPRAPRTSWRSRTRRWPVRATCCWTPPVNTSVVRAVTW